MKWDRVIRSGVSWIAAVCAVFLLVASIPLEAKGQERELALIRLSVGEGQETPLFRAGEQAELRINVRNSGNVDANNVIITPVVEEEESWPFEMERLNYGKEMGTIRAGADAAAVWGAEKEKLTVKSTVTGKAYKLVFHIAYDDGTTLYETVKYVFVRTEALQSPSSGDSSGEPGQSPSDSGAAQKPQEMAGGTYQNGEPAVLSGGEVAGGTTPVPRVIVTGFDTQPGEVRAGSDFKLIVHVKNTSRTTAVSNMVCDFQASPSGTETAAEAPAFLPSSGASSVYVDRISAGGTKDIEINLNARADLIQKPYSISMSMKYEDRSATQYEALSSLAIPVKQEARFEFSEIQVAPDTISAGDEVNISCSLYNLGRVKMYNIKVRIEGEAIRSSEQFLGNLDAGGAGVIDSIVSTEKETAEGEMCKLVLSYEDDAGNVSTAEQPFSITVLPQTDVDDIGMLTEEMGEENGFPVLPVAMLILLTGGVTLAAASWRKRKKRNQDLEEEELFDEVERSAEDER